MSNDSATQVAMSIPFDSTKEVHFDELLGLQAYSYQDVSRILTDDTHFSAAYSLPSEDQHPVFAGMWAADDPRHADLRSLAADPFRPRVLFELSQKIRKIADDLLDSILDRRSQTFEIMTDFARPYAFRILCLILDVESSDYKRFIRWQDELRKVQAVGQTPAQPDFVAYLRNLLIDRQRHPRLSLVDELISSYQNGHKVAGKPLSEWDLIGYLATLLTAGADTSAAGLANALVSFVENGCLEQLSKNHSLIGPALEEALCYNPAFPAIRRNIQKRVNLGGKTLQKGQFVTAWVSAANRDFQQFKDPNSFQITRTPNRHLSFGWAKHHCLGSALARLEMRIALEALIERIPKPLYLAKPVEYTFSVVHAPQEGHFLWG